MTPVGITVHLPRELTAAALDAIPSDGRRWELIDGSLHVTPAPSGRHQTVTFNLAVLLRQARAPGTAVMIAPFDYRPFTHTNLQPDLAVIVAEEALLQQAIETPLLVVEVLSPSTRTYDLGTKRLAYESLGVPCYWLVDPDAPGIIALELVEGRFLEVAQAGPGGAIEVERPFPVRIEVDRLLDL